MRRQKPNDSRHPHVRKPLHVVVLFSLLTANTAASERPNVLMIIVDDMNDFVGCLGGHPDAKTPNIDQLAARGMLFTNAHCAAPVCNASRVATMTGMRPGSTGIYDNGVRWHEAMPDIQTIPQHFKDSGYLTFGGGKVYHHMPGFNRGSDWNNYFDQRFDGHYQDLLSRGMDVSNFQFPDGFPLNQLPSVKALTKPPKNPREFDWGPLDKPEFATGDGKMIEWATKLLRQPVFHPPSGRVGRGSGRGGSSVEANDGQTKNKSAPRPRSFHSQPSQRARREGEAEKPFFLAAGIYRPHLPFYAPREYFDLYEPEDLQLPTVKEDDIDDLPASGQKFASQRREDYELVVKSKKFREMLHAYLASISFADAMIGYLIDALDASGHLENTVIVLWSDHGWHFGEKQHLHKMTLWERATRVPFIVIAPGVTQPNSKCEQPVGLIDVFPTLIDLCELRPVANLDGQSIVPLLRDPDQRWDRPALTSHGRGNHALRTDRWRYIRYANGDKELYDHESDPHEWTNLADQEQFAGIKSEMKQWFPESDAKPKRRSNKAKAKK